MADIITSNRIATDKCKKDRDKKKDKEVLFHDVILLVIVNKGG